MLDENILTVYTTPITRRHDIAEILLKVALNWWRKPEYPQKTTDLPFTSH
jgi:hypothetical protein